MSSICQSAFAIRSDRSYFGVYKIRNIYLWTILKENMKNFNIIFCIILIVQCVHFIDAKRSFGLTSRRSKSKSPSVRRGQHGHDDDHAPLPKPPPPDAKKNIGWNTNQAHNTHHNPSAPPLGPAGLNNAPQGGLYSGSSHHQPPPYGMHHQSPPAYSPGFTQPKPIFGQNPAYGAPGYGNMMMTGGSPMMGMPVMGVMPMQSRGSFGGGIMTNLFAGLAGYQLAKAFSGGSGYHQRDRDVIIINNPPAQPVSGGEVTPPLSAANQPIPISNAYPQTPLNPPPSSVVTSSSGSSSDESTEMTPNTTEFMPKNNEYNYWGFPQYGVPLYGYNLPSQITEYYQIDTIKLNHDSQQQQEATS